MNNILLLRVSHLLGISGYAGSIFAMIVLGRTHDFSADWKEVITSRSDIWHILIYVNLPSLLLLLATDIWLLRFRSDPGSPRLVRLKWVLHCVCVVLTVGIIAGAAHSMVTLAEQAPYNDESAAGFHRAHLREDIAGPINLIAFWISVAIGIRLNEQKTK